MACTFKIVIFLFANEKSGQLSKVIVRLYIFPRRFQEMHFLESDYSPSYQEFHESRDNSLAFAF